MLAWIRYISLMLFYSISIISDDNDNDDSDNDGKK